MRGRRDAKSNAAAVHTAQEGRSVDSRTSIEQEEP